MGNAGGRRGRGQEVWLEGGSSRCLPGNLPQRTRHVPTPTPGLGTGTDGRLPACHPRFRGPASAGRSNEGRNHRPRRFRVAQAGTVVDRGVSARQDWKRCLPAEGGEKSTEYIFFFLGRKYTLSAFLGRNRRRHGPGPVRKAIQTSIRA